MRTLNSAIASIVVAGVHLVPAMEAAATVPKQLPKDVEAVEVMYQQAKLEGATGAAFDQLLHIGEDRSASVPARQHAVDRIGALGYAEAKPTLERLLESTTQEDTASGLRARVHLAYWRVVVAQEDDPERRRTILVDLTDAKVDESIMTQTRSWAIDEICALGQPDLLPMAQAAIRKLDSTERGADEAQVCQLKSELVARHPSRVEALAAALEMEDPSRAGILHRWAIEELADVAGSAADDVLAEHAKRLAQAKGPGKQGTLRTVVEVLKLRGWTDEDFREAGILVTKFL